GRMIKTTSGLTAYLGGLTGLGLPLEEVSAYPAAINAVTADDVARAAAEHIDPDQAVIVVVGDAAQSIERMRARWPQVEVIAAEELDLARADLGLSAAE